MQCRSNIQNYLTNNFKDIITFKHEQHCKVYAVSNFYNYFNDLCNTYLPYIVNNELPVNSFIKAVCDQKITSSSFSFEVGKFKTITDEICLYWGNTWEGWQAIYAKDACFAGNHNYEVLKLLGALDEQEIHVDKADWALGAALNS